jgi:hypothetical protein
LTMPSQFSMQNSELPSHRNLHILARPALSLIDRNTTDHLVRLLPAYNCETAKVGIVRTHHHQPGDELWNFGGIDEPSPFLCASLIG